ncbi:MAG: tRNA uridine-5-carboxymethylaminomethyl(34) synthesis GTPase MnmE [Syntrophorhabdaceae bacterium]|nr:tRNA uridine-5-carboxymethylaminomethyl(34) synthesis GTPase MnmE [Syntrophorhabdaceae bacterium]
MERDDTICAISTPYGEGGIGIIRLSGEKSHHILKNIFRPKKMRARYQSRLLHLGHIVDPENGAYIDEVYAVFFDSPKTYTREKMAEVYCHGGYASQATILKLMLKHGARLAEPGEFTKRAYLNGRIDLLQAESVLDIVQSETEEELKNATCQLKGTLSNTINNIKDRLRDSLVNIEALLDFPEEDIEVELKGILDNLNTSRNEIGALIDTYFEGRAIKQGIEALIIGKPNVGKSSLLNALLSRERAIVTPIPGTTRDIIEDTIIIRGIKVKIIDSAGIRRPKDEIEQKGIERVKEKIPYVDIILWVVDSSERPTFEDDEIYEEIKNYLYIMVINKIDLQRRLPEEWIEKRCKNRIEVSALKGEGLDGLKKSIYEAMIGKKAKREGALITNLRHKKGLDETKKALDRALISIENREPLEFTAFEIQEGLSRLSEITGEGCPNDILEEIFNRFCIGK